MVGEVFDITMRMKADTSDFDANITKAISQSSKEIEKGMGNAIGFVEKKMNEFQRVQTQMFESGVLPSGMSKSMYNFESSVGKLATSIITYYNDIMKYGNTLSETQTAEYTQLSDNLSTVTKSIDEETQKILTLESQMQAVDFIMANPDLVETALHTLATYDKQMQDLETREQTLQTMIDERANILKTLASEGGDTQAVYSSDVAKETVALINAKDAITAQKEELAQANERALQYKSALDAIADSNVVVDEEGRADLGQQYEDAKQKVVELTATQSQLTEQLQTTQQFEYNVVSQESVERLKSMIANLFALTSNQSGIVELYTQLDQATQKANELAVALAEVAKADTFAPTEEETVEQMNERFKEMTETLVQLQMIRAQALKESTVTMEMNGETHFIEDLNNAKPVVDGVTISMEELDKRIASLMVGLETLRQRIDLSEQSQQTSDEIDEVTQKLEDMGAVDMSGTTDSMEEVKEGVKNIDKQVSVMGLSRTITMVGRLFQRWTGINVTGITMTIRTVMRLATLTKEQLVGAVTLLKKKVVELFTLIISNPIVAVITAILALVVVLITKINKMKEEFEEGFKELFDDIKNLVEKAKEKFKDLFAFIMRNAVTLLTFFERLVFTLAQYIAKKLSELKSQITEGLKDMAKWRGGLNEVNTALSNLTSSLNYLKATLATAFAPILTYIEPLLTRFIDGLAEVITYIGMFIAVITGKDSFIKAIRLQKDYAKSLDNTSKKAKSNLATFDKINNLNDDKDEKDNSLADYGLINLEEVPLPDWLKDFENMGKKFGEWLRDLLNGIPWQKIFKYVYGMAEGLAKFINGFVKVEGLPEAIGNSFRKILTLATVFVRKFFATFDGQNFGKFLRTILETFFDVDAPAFGRRVWYELGQALTDPINALADIMNGLFNGFKNTLGEDIGKAISEAIQGALNNLHWEDIKSAFSSLGYQLAEMFNNIFTDENLEKAGEALANSIGAVFEFVGNFARTGKIKDWFGAIAKGINKFFEETPAEQIGENLNALIQSVLDGIHHALLTLDTEQLAQTIVDALGQIKWDTVGKKISVISDQLYDVFLIIWDKLEETGVMDDIIKLFARLVAEKLSWKKLFESIIGYFTNINFSSIDNLKEYFSGGDLWDLWDVYNSKKSPFDEKKRKKKRENDMPEVGGDVNGNDPEEAFNDVKSSWRDTNQSMREEWDITETHVSEGCENVSEVYTSSFDKIADVSANAKTELIDDATQIADGVSQSFEDVGDAIVKPYQTVLDESDTKLVSPFQRLGQRIRGALVETDTATDTESQDIGKYAVKGALAGAEIEVASSKNKWDSNVWGQLIKDAKQLLGIASPSKVFMEIGENTVKGFLLPFESLKGKFIKIWLTIQQAGVSAVTTMSKMLIALVTTMSNNIATILATMAKNIISSLSSVINRIKTNLASALSGGLDFGTFNSALDKVSQHWSTLWTDMASIAKTNANAVIKYLNGILEGYGIMINTDLVKAVENKTKKPNETVSLPSIPYLAHGAVIPPNKQFLAMLGDQKSGTNVEAPLSTIEQALRNVLGDFGVNVTFNVKGDPTGMFKVIQDESHKFTRRTGLKAFT